MMHRVIHYSLGAEENCSPELIKLKSRFGFFGRGQGCGQGIGKFLQVSVTPGGYADAPVQRSEARHPDKNVSFDESGHDRTRKCAILHAVDRNEIGGRW
jgi:hypothetical protein